MTASPALIDFARSLYGPISNRAALESLDLGALARLEGVERDAAELMLREELEQMVEDPRVPPALKLIRSQTAVEAMKAALEKYRPDHTKVALAAALWELEEYPPSIEAMVEAGLHGPFPEIRIGALYALADTSDPRADAVLATALATDAEQGVRLSANSALHERYRIDGFQRSPPPELATVQQSLRSPEPQQREAALTEFRALAQRLTSTSKTDGDE